MSLEDRVRGFWRRIWSEGDIAYAHEFFAPHYLQNDRTTTPAQLGQAALAFREFFPDLTVEVLRIFTGGDFVVSRVCYLGSYAGGWPGVASAGQHVTVNGLDLFRFDDGRVVEHLHEADHEAMWEQLGVRLPPA